MSVGQRRMWRFVPDDQEPLLMQQPAERLDRARRPDGTINLRQDVRYTVGRLALS